MRLLLSILFFFTLGLTAQTVNVRYIHADTPMDSSLFPKQVASTIELNKQLKTAQLKNFANGYIAFSVDSIITKDSLNLVVHLQHGQPHIWGKVKWNIHNDVIRRANLSPKKLRNKQLNPNSFYKGIDRVINYYEDNGFPFASVKLDSAYFIGDTLNGNLTLDIGDAVTYDSLVIHGNARIKKYYLNQYLGIHPGKVYDESTVQEIDKKLKELPYVKLKRPSTVEFLNKKASIHIFIDHKKAGFFNGVIGILPNQNNNPQVTAQTQSNILITGDLQLILANALKYGERFEFKWKRLQTETQRLNTSFMFPYLFNTPFGTEYKLDLLKQDTTFLNVKHKIGVNYSIGARTNLKAFYSNNNTTQISSKPLSASVINTVGSNANSYGLEFSHDKRDYRFNPRKGYFASIGGQAGSKKINASAVNGRVELPISSNDTSVSVTLSIPQISILYSIEGTFNYFIPLFKITTLKLGLQGAYIINPYLLESDLFRIGGFRRMRGFDEQSIFASAYSIGTLEYRLLLERNSFVSIFYDQGYTQKNTILAFDQDWPLGFGAGINFQTKPGIFSISYAVGRQQSNPIDFRSAKIHFGFISLF